MSKITVKECKVGNRIYLVFDNLKITTYVMMSIAKERFNCSRSQLVLQSGYFDENEELVISSTYQDKFPIVWTITRKKQEKKQ